MTPLPRLALPLLVLVAALSGSAGCGGGGGSGGGAGGGGAGTTLPPALYAYDISPALYRVGQAAAPNAPIPPSDPASLAASGPVSQWSVAPALPTGLVLDPVTGVITGLPSVEAATADYVIKAWNAAGFTQTVLPLLVGPELPPGVQSLALGFAITEVHRGLNLPTKMALAPDGRILFPELKSGAVRVIDAGGQLLPTPFASLTVQGAGSHQGLLALALAPDFGTSGHVYVLFSAPADGTHGAEHMRLERFTDVANVGTNRTVILDNLPTGSINNGADIVFDLTGNLLVSLGDTNVSANAQDPASPAGKVLRLTPTGGIPADNPTPGSLVWVSGLRNTFGLAVHPVTGGLFGVDNGPAADDELNYLVAGKNCGWGAAVPVPGALAGLKIRNWQTEIVPTALAWHPGGAWGADYADDLFVASYDREEVQRFEMSGTARTDIDLESVFLAFTPLMTDRKPLDLVVAPDGSLYVSTFTGIWKVTKL